MNVASPLPASVPNGEAPGIPPLLGSLRAVAYALMSVEGRLLAANEGFRILLQQTGAALTDVAPHIVNPSFAELSRADVDAGTLLHRGFITLVDSAGQSRSLVGVIYRRDDCIEIVGEHDIAEQERLLATVLQLNDELAEQQRAACRANRELALRQQELADEIARRQAIEADLRREKDAQAALLARLTAAQNRLLQAEKMASVGQLAAGVAHEINNPLGFVSSNLTSLGEYFADLLAVIDAYAATDALIARDPQVAGEIGRIRAACDPDFIRSDGAALLAESRKGLDRVKKIVLDLRNFARVDESQWQEANVHTCLDSTLDVAAHTLGDKVEVRREYGELPPLRCCPGLLNQAFMSLIVNAAQAIAGRGHIIVRTACADDDIQVEIEDNGCGIARENLDRIFEPFFTTKPVGEGSGLGLSLAWSIVKAHGGRVEVDSSVGEGSRFRVWLPVRGACMQERCREGDGVAGGAEEGEDAR